MEKSDAQTLIFALDNYKDIYNRYPPASPQGEAAKCNARLLRILMGHDGDENPKRIAFIGIHEEKNKLLDYVLKMTGLRPLRELDQPLFITEAGKHGEISLRRYRAKDRLVRRPVGNSIFHSDHGSGNRG